MVMKKVFDIFKNTFSAPSYTSKLEEYILSKRIKNNAELEFWIKEFERKNQTV